MIKKYLCRILIILPVAAAAFAQGTFTPRDADEEQAWQIYNEYKESRRIEAPLEAQIKAKFDDAFGNAVGSVAIVGVDWDANAAAKKKVAQLAIERKRQSDLLAAWEKKFYWRYGDLRWSNEKIYDQKTKRQMDRIEFALIYFPFNFKPAVKPPAIVNPPVKPPTAATSIEGSYSGTLTGDSTGTLTFVVKGTNITGNLSGVFGSKRWPLLATFTGSVGADRRLYEVLISGTVGGTPFTGSLWGDLLGGKAGGDFTGITGSQAPGSTSYRGYLGGHWAAAKAAGSSGVAGNSNGLSVEYDTDRPGADYRNFDLPEANFELCRTACARDAQCKAYTYVKPGVQGPNARCWLKSSVAGSAKSTSCISGMKP